MTPRIAVGSQRSPATDISEPFLMAKISPPRLADWVVSRPRIDRLIDRGVQRGAVTLVEGPPGAGKTTALAHWLTGRRWRGPVAWLTLDEYDDTADYFWRSVSAALRRAGIPVPAAVLDDTADAPLLLASAIAAQPTPAVLVLDNLHMIRSRQRIAGLGYLTQHTKPRLRIVAGTRANEPLPLHTYRLTGDLTEVRAEQLAFTGPETRTLLARHDVAAYREALMPLVKRAEGWVTGLRFVAIALNGDGAVRVTDVGELIDRYLISEAFDSQPARMRDFLLRTSVPDRISQGLARALGDTGAPLLHDLVQANLFVSSVGGGWYRYHTLFRDVLRARLQSEAPDLFADLLRRTAEWHRRQGQLADAVRCAAEVGDGALAARLIVDELTIGRLLDPDRGQSLLRGLQGAPAPAATACAGECAAAAALALTRQDHESAAAWLGRADELLRPLPPEAELTSRQAVAVVRFGLARSAGDLSALADAAAEQEGVLARLPAQVVSAHREVQVQTLGSRGDAELWLGHFDDAEKIFAEAAALPAAPPTEDAADVADDASGERASCLGRLALAEAMGGRLVRAAEVAAKAIAAEAEAGDCPAGGEPRPDVAAEIALAWVCLERGDLARVRTCLKRVEAGLRARHDRAAAALASLIASWLYLAEGRCEGAIGMLRGARQDWLPPDWLDQRLVLAEARAEAMAGNPAAARRAVSRCTTMPAVDAAVARAQVWVAAGDLAAARRELRHVFEAAATEPARSVDRVMLDALLIDARIRYATGERGAGRVSLARALRIARGEDIRLPFDMEHSWLFPVLRADPELARGYQSLSQPDGAAERAHGAGPLAATMAEPALIEPLTEREQEVLRRVAQLMSTEEIANELYISVNTVKTHLKSVHRKLAVTHRREAVRRAMQLKLL